MFIQLTEDRVIKSDSSQVMLCKPVMNNKKNEIEWIPFRFYRNLDQLLKSVPQQMLRDSDATSLKECIQLLRDWEKRVDELLN